MYLINGLISRPIKANIYWLLCFDFNKVTFFPGLSFTVRDQPQRAMRRRSIQMHTNAPMLEAENAGGNTKRFTRW